MEEHTKSEADKGCTLYTSCHNTFLGRYGHATPLNSDKFWDFDSAPEYCADPRTIVELESDADGWMRRWMLNACLGVGGMKVYSKRAVGMGGIRANEAIYSGQNGYYCKKIMMDR